MKILHVAETIKGGIASYLNDLLIHQKIRYTSGEIRILVPDYQAKEIEHGEVCVTFKGGNKRGLAGYYNLAKAFRKNINEFSPDIIHIHSTFAGIVCRLILIGTQNRVVIYCPHGWSFNRQTNTVAKIFYRSTERLLSNFTNRIICISDHEYDTALIQGISSKKLVTIKNAISVNRQNTVEKKEKPLILRRQDGKINLLFVGRLDKQKGLDVLLQGFKKLNSKKYHLHIVGESVLADSYTELVESVNYYGWLNKEDVLNAMRACDCLIVPSRWEGFGLVVLEAYEANCPVIASKVGGLTELVNDGVTGYLVKPGNVEDLCKKINMLNPEMLLKFRGIIENLELKNYTMAVLEEKMHILYSNSVIQN